MGEALDEAKKAAVLGEVPVGVVLAVDGKIVARAYNLVESSIDATAHAEMLAMHTLSRAQSNWRLSNVVLCATLEPCVMCTGAIRLARIPTVIFGAGDSRFGAMGSVYNLLQPDRTGAPPTVIGGVRADEARALLQSFFAARRAE